jgi:hypothetical protein
LVEFAGAAEHGGVGDVERRTASGERGDVIDGQVGGGVVRALVARADVAVLPDVARDHPPGQASPSGIGMDEMVGTNARQAWMLAAASSRSAGDDTADRAELHGRIVDGAAGVVYSPAVLRLGDHGSPKPHGIKGMTGGRSPALAWRGRRSSVHVRCRLHP